MNNRFELVKYEELPLSSVNPRMSSAFYFTLYVLKDKVTGVLYMYNEFGNSAGLTPLIDADGKPLTSL